MANSFWIPYNMISKQSNHQSTNLLFKRTHDSEWTTELLQEVLSSAENQMPNFVH